MVDLKLKVLNASLGTAVGAETVDTADEGFAYLNTHYNGANIWNTYLKFSDNHSYCRCYSDALTPRFAAVDLGGGFPVLVSERSTVGVLVRSGISWRTISLAGTLGAEQSGVTQSAGADTMYAASKPFAPATGANALYVWAVSFTPTFRSYYLVELIAATGIHTGRCLIGPVARSSGIDGYRQANAAYVAIDDGIDNQTHWAATVTDGSDAGSVVPLAHTGIDRITTRDVLSQRMAARLGPALYVAGGEPVIWDLVQTSELAMHVPPIAPIASVGAEQSSGLTPGFYSYVAVTQWYDDFGQKHRSAPSFPDTLEIPEPPAWNNAIEYNNGDWVTHEGVYYESGSTQSANEPPDPDYWTPGEYTRHANIAIRWSGLTRRTDAVVHLYRTLRNGTIFYRCTPNSGAPENLVTTSWVDGQPDSAIATKETLYTDGGLLPFVDPPPCDFLIAALNRLVAAGLETPTQVVCSRELIAGEPAQWSDSPAFGFTVGDEVTGLATQDDAIIVFSRDRIWLVYGPGPDDRGVGSFTVPRELPTNVGCADYRSIIETDAGIIFLGSSTVNSEPGMFYLLPRGGGSPVFIGQPVRDTLGAFPTVRSAAIDPSQHLVTFLLDDGEDSKLLHYNYRNAQWMVDTLSLQRDCIAYVEPSGPGFLGGGRRLTLFGSTMQRAAAGVFADSSGGYIETLIETGAIRPFGLQGHGRVRSFRVLGEYVGAHELEVSYSIDGSNWVSQDFTLSGLTAGNSFDLWVRVATPKCSEFFVRLVDSQSGGAATGGYKAKGVSLEVVPRSGGPRLGSAYRGG